MQASSGTWQARLFPLDVALSEPTVGHHTEAAGRPITLWLYLNWLLGNVDALQIKNLAFPTGISLYGVITRNEGLTYHVRHDIRHHTSYSLCLIVGI
jgi:hypothetical protein